MIQIFSNLTVFVMVASLTFPAVGVAGPVFRKIKESNLRQLADLEGDYSEFSYMVDFLDNLRACGIEGDIVQMDRPVFGLHLLVRSVDLRKPCYSGHWELLDDAQARERMFQMVTSGRFLLITLESLRRYHSILMDPAVGEFAQAMAQTLRYEKETSVILFLGRQALFEKVRTAESARGFTEEILDLGAMNLPTSIRLKLFRLLAQLHRAEWREEPGLFAVEAELGGRHLMFASPTQISRLKVTLTQARLPTELVNDVLLILRPYLQTQQYLALKHELTTSCENELSLRNRRGFH